MQNSTDHDEQRNRNKIGVFHEIWIDFKSSKYKFSFYAFTILLIFIATACVSETPIVVNTPTSNANYPTSTDIPAMNTPLAKATITNSPSIPPTNGLVKTDTPLPDAPSVVVFSYNSASTELPENLMDQISYFGQPGGGGGDWDPCEDAPSNQPSFLNEPRSEICLYCSGYYDTCGWKSNEKIRITIGLANGDSYKDEKRANKYGYLRYYFEPTAEDISGGYTVAFKGANGKIKAKFHKIAPDETGTFLDGNVLLLYNFVPYEKIKLHLYKELQSSLHEYHIKFVGWQDYRVDSEGKLRINIELDTDNEYQYEIIGEESGAYSPLIGPKLVPVGSKNQPTATSIIQIYKSVFSCWNSDISISIGSEAEVVFPEGAPIFDDPESSYHSIEEPMVVDNGVIVKIIDGPYCVEGNIFWLVELSNKDTGWIPEEMREKKYLSPIN